jgi:acetyl-CoA C-acetyltransferase
MESAGAVSGVRIVLSLLYEMRRRNLHLGLPVLRIGGGQGTGAVVEH